MLYKGELVVDRGVKAWLVDTATHPSQVVRKMINIADAKQTRHKYFELYVMNEDGQAWKYAVKRTNGSYDAKKIGKTSYMLGMDSVHSILAGNQYIKDVV